MTQNDKTGTEEEYFSLYCVQGVQKDRRKKIWNVPGNPCWVQQWLRSVWREAHVCWMIWRIMRIEFSFFSDKQTFNVNPVFNKQNDLVKMSGNDVSEHRRVSTTKHSATFMILGGGKDGICKRERFISGSYKEVLETKVLPWIKKITRKSDHVFYQDWAPVHTTMTVQNWLDGNRRFWSKNFWPTQSLDFNSFDFSWWTHIEKKARKTHRGNTDEPKASVNRAWRSMREGHRQRCHIE